MTARDEKMFLAISDSHTSEGWGTPPNEFMIRLPHLRPDHYGSFAIDLKALEQLIGPVTSINGLRLRPELKLSHFWVCDDLPNWLKSATFLSADDAPLVTIEHPHANAAVGRRERVHGRFKNLKDKRIKLFVYSPDNHWYLQQRPTTAGDQWSADVFFGSEDGGVGAQFKFAALATDDTATEQVLERLPSAAGRFVVSVVRKS
jgi:hypothetical protein